MHTVKKNGKIDTEEGESSVAVRKDRCDSLLLPIAHDKHLPRYLISRGLGDFKGRLHYIGVTNEAYESISAPIDVAPSQKEGVAAFTQIVHTRDAHHRAALG